MESPVPEMESVDTYGLRLGGWLEAATAATEELAEALTRRLNLLCHNGVSPQGVKQPGRRSLPNILGALLILLDHPKGHTGPVRQHSL